MLQEAILPALNSPTATAPCGRAGNFNHRFVYDSTKERDAKPGNTSTRSAFAELGRSHFGGGIDVSIYRVTLRDRETKTVVGYYNGAWTTDQRRALALRKRESAAAHAAARLLSAQR
jgi:hypothetical protein